MSARTRTLAALAVAVWGIWSATAMSEVRVDGLGDWDLRRLGAGPIELPTDKKRAAESVRFSLPESARQGPETWYLIHLHFIAQVARDTGSGSVYVTASTNGRAAQMVEIEVTRRAGRRPRVRWNTLDQIRGADAGTARRQRVQLDVENYLQDRGVRPGRNKLTFDVERRGAAKLERVRVLADSGIRVTDRSPAHLVLTTSLPAGRIVAGEWFEVGYELVNDGDLVARHIGVGLEPPSRELQVSRPQYHRQPTLGPGERLSGMFRVRGRKAGDFRLELAASAENANHPLIEISVPIGEAGATPPTSTDGAGGVHIALPVVFGALLTMAAAVARRRRSGYEAAAT